MLRSFLVPVLATIASASVAATPTPRDTAYPATISLRVDATDLEHRVVRVRESIPARRGPLTLLYPQWIPGTHSPSGRVDALAGLVITAAGGDGTPLDWVRDPANVYAFHIDVPVGVRTLDVEFQITASAGEMPAGSLMTPDILAVQWNTVVLYPAGHYVSRITVQPSLTVPSGWDVATALETTHRDGGTVRFRETSLETLVDSPAYAGSHFKAVSLNADNAPPVRLSIFTDLPEELSITPEQLDVHRRLVSEATALFGSRHYDHYDFLMVISENFPLLGLEHQRSSENSVPRGYFKDWENAAVHRGILPHELVHSWNGKFRRPADQWTPDFNTPMQNSLLWVYEGLTEYWTKILGARSGLWTKEAVLDAIAADAAVLQERDSGREWRNLRDTTNQPIAAQRRGLAFESWQRGENYYREGMLVWLEVDARLRELTGNKRSLDDFSRIFHGVNDGSSVPVTYTFDDVVRVLNAVAPWDWAGLLRKRLDLRTPHAPLEGLERTGWKLVFNDKPNGFIDRKAGPERIDFSYSLGLSLDKDAKLVEVVWGGVAFNAGLAPGMKLLGVNGRTFRMEYLQNAMRQAQEQGNEIELLASALDRYRTVKLAYRGGLRYPHLERIEANADLLTDIVKPRT